MSGRTYVIGTRGSRLALAQTDIVLAVLRPAHPGATFGVREIRTSGDATTASLSEIGGRGVFVIEIEQALLRGEIDLAVHSLKDLPSEETPGLTIAATLPREQPWDALVSRDGQTLQQLPAGAVIGTGSPRRAAQVRAIRPDVEVRDIRGNVDTRVRKVTDGDYDAVVLAAAGLSRLGWLDRAAEIFSPDVMLPSVGQGALALQCRADDADALSLLSAVDDADTHVATTAERAFERRLGGGCHAAIAALGELSPLVGRGSSLDRNGATLRLRGLVGSADGRLIAGELTGAPVDAEALGVRLAEQLIEQGAAALLEAAG